eukprot:scaffold8311_cov93-Cylindrotheca_fusiformis.AAC.2
MGDATTGDVIHSDEATKTKRGSAPRGIIVIEGNELGIDGISIQVRLRLHWTKRIVREAVRRDYYSRIALVRNAQRVARNNKYFTGCTQCMNATYAILSVCQKVDLSSFLPSIAMQLLRV